MTFDIHYYFRAFTELAMILPAAAIALIPVWRFRRFRVRSILLSAAVPLLLFMFGGSLLCTLCSLPSNYVIFPMTIPFYAAYHFSFKLSFSKKLFCFLHSAMLCSFSTLYGVFATAPMEVGNKSNILYISSGLVCIGISLLVTAIFFRTLAVKLPELLENSSLDRIWRALILVPLLMTILCVWITPISPEYALVGRIRPGSMLVLPIIPIVTWVLFQIQWWVTKQIEANSELQRSYDILKLEEKRYANTMQALEEARNLRHDFRQHLLVINDLAKQGKTDELTSYIEPFLQTAGETHRQHFKNYVLDAVASHYIEIAEKQHTRLIWNIGLPEELPFKLSDICAVLGNLLENALNAMANLPEEKREARIAMGLKSDAVLVISVTNPYSGVVRKDSDGFPIALEKEHGIGLKSISNTVKRYSGSLSIDTDNGIFDVSIILNSEKI